MKITILVTNNKRRVYKTAQNSEEKKNPTQNKT